MVNSMHGLNIETIFLQQREYFYSGMHDSSLKQRINRLKALKSLLVKNEDEIVKALSQDLNKHSYEACLTEIFMVYSELEFAIKNLKKWCKPKYQFSNKAHLFATSYIEYSPKGVCLIMAPWNYPFQLVIAPLVSALAAGNVVVIKPSELAPKVATLVGELLIKVFPEREVAVVKGDAKVATELLKQPFDHIFFTGSTKVGKIVMQAAAQHLTPVTLELGGKSPVIVFKHADLKRAARKIVWGKFTNAGQTCIAPDYILVEEACKNSFIGYLKDAIHELYYKDGNLRADEYVKIISPAHFDRLRNLLEDALRKGASVIEDVSIDAHERIFPPVVLENISRDMDVMKEEIFGPLLPVLTFKEVAETISFIRNKPKPLALYVFSKRESDSKLILSSLSSGGACINDVVIHISNPYLPFSGIGESGMGASHGFYGFRSFSHERAILKQNRWIDLTRLAYPPYNGKEWVLNWIRKIV